jgi:hypothetical protein
MSGTWPATGFWLYRIGQKNGQVAIVELIWCGPGKTGAKS